MESFGETLGSFATTMFRLSAIAFLVVNGATAAAFIMTRDRHLVNRWTGRLLALNLLLLGTGVAAPMVANAMKLVVAAVSVNRAIPVKVE